MSTEQQEVAQELHHPTVLSNGPGNSAGFASLGKCLQQARVQAGYSVQQIASEMHLEPRFIELIERDRFRELGAPVFVKGHVRRYARLVNVDEALFQGLYASLRDPPVAADPIPVSMNSIPVSRKLVPNWALWTTAAVFAVISVATMVNKLNAPADIQASVKQPAIAKSRTGNLDRSPLSESATVETAVNKSGVVLASVTPVATANARESDEVVDAHRAVLPGHVALTLTFSGDSWVEVYDANKRSVFQELGHNGDVRDIEAVAPLRVVLGSAPQVVLHVNGHVTTIPAKKVMASVARFSVNAEGVIN